MAKGNYSPEPFDEETNHRQLVWEEFLVRSVEAANKAIEWLELAEYEDETGISDDEIQEIYEQRWESTGTIVTDAFNFLWPEIESLAIKLGVPFEPEISEIDK
jgi:hypothetical protein